MFVVIPIPTVVSRVSRRDLAAVAIGRIRIFVTISVATATMLVRPKTQLPTGARERIMLDRFRILETDRIAIRPAGFKTERFKMVQELSLPDSSIG